MRFASILALAGFACMLIAGAAFGVTIISKPPDLGPYWNPVGNEPTYVYADCFIAPGGSDLTVTQLGTWLEPIYETPHATVRFEIWGTIANGPDCNNVIAATATFSTETPNLNLYTLPVVSGGGPLVTGVKYFFVITGVGLGSPNYGEYRVGAHTQNSVYQDNCTFWYSNDPSGCPFDGTNLTPEMAFEVTLSGTTAVEPLAISRIKALYR